MAPMHYQIEIRIKAYLSGTMKLMTFYDWYMNWHWENPDEDNRVTLVLYEYTSEPIRSDPGREEWLKREFVDILLEAGRWAE
jgi:hypothetical protein